MDLHKFIAETLLVTEHDLMNGPKEPQEPEVAQEPAQAPEVNDELVASLSNDLPELKNVDQEELMKGLSTEMEHFDSVGGDVNIVAKLTLDHLQEYPGQKYYSALEQLESELSKAAEQAVAPAPESEPVAEEPVTEPEVATEEPVASPEQFEPK